MYVVYSHNQVKLLEHKSKSKPKTVFSSNILEVGNWRMVAIELPQNKVGVSIQKRRGKIWEEIVYLPPDIINNTKSSIKLPKYLIKEIPWIREQPDIEVVQ